MKKLLLLLIIPFLSFGQTLNNIPVSELDVKYIQIVATQKLLKLYEVTINVNYGQVSKMNQAKNSIVYGADGKAMTFNGMMDAVNFFANYGYQLEFAYPVGNTQGGSVYHYVMYKPDSENTHANTIHNIDALICECNFNLKNGHSSDQCQALFLSYDLNSQAGKLRWKQDLERLECE